MYKSPFLIYVVFPLIILSFAFLLYFYYNNIEYLIIGLVLAVWLFFYLKNLIYIIDNENLIKKTGRFLKIEKTLKLDKIISFSFYNLKILKINILIIKHLEGRMFITFLKEKQIKNIIEKL